MLLEKADKSRQLRLFDRLADAQRFLQCTAQASWYACERRRRPFAGWLISHLHTDAELERARVRLAGGAHRAAPRASRAPEPPPPQRELPPIEKAAAVPVGPEKEYDPTGQHMGRMYAGPRNQQGRGRDYYVVLRPKGDAAPAGATALRPLGFGTLRDVEVPHARAARAGARAHGLVPQAMQADRYLARDAEGGGSFWYAARVHQLRAQRAVNGRFVGPERPGCQVGGHKAAATAVSLPPSTPPLPQAPGRFEAQVVW